MNDKIGGFYLPTKSPDKNLSCVMQKSPEFFGQDRACSIFTDFVGRFCRATQPRSQKSADFVVRLTFPLALRMGWGFLWRAVRTL